MNIDSLLSCADITSHVCVTHSARLVPSGHSLCGTPPWSKRGRLPLPLGPKGWPLIGNMFNMPNENFAQTYMEWVRTYGDIVCINVAGHPSIFLGSCKVANELLDEKRAIYSDRPFMEMAGELSGSNKWTGFMGYGPRWKETRKYMHHAIGAGNPSQNLAPFLIPRLKNS